MPRDGRHVAFIFGVNGQDGAYLAKLLLHKGYIVYGSSRDHQSSSFNNLNRLGIREQVNVVTTVPDDFRSVLLTLEKFDPDEIYYLAGQSSVSLSFELPLETIQSTVNGTLNVLEACRVYNKAIRIFFAGSGECFGDTNGRAASESTPFNPKSPYAVAKVSSYWLVSNYREAYGLHASTGILFNHESPLRPERFVTQKVVQAAKRINSGHNEKLRLGRLDIMRDWGWAPEYVLAMWNMLQLQSPDDFVIATGELLSLQNFVSIAFEEFGLDWREHVIQDSSLYRPTDILLGRADPTKAGMKLNWTAKIKGRAVVEAMLRSEFGEFKMLNRDNYECTKN